MPVIDSYTWGVLLVPNAILIVVALIRRTAAWRHAVAFSLGNLVVDVVIGYWDVYALGQMDEKFRRAPDVAFEVSLIGAGIFSALGGVLLVVSSAVSNRVLRMKPLPKGQLSVSALAGAVDAVGGRLLYSAFGQTGAYAPLAWAWMCCFTLFYVIALVSIRGNNAPRQAAVP